jgi:uncharacterized protein
MKKYLIRVVRGLMLAYLGVLIFLALSQRRMIYYPERDTEESMLKKARYENLQPWRSSDGALIGWRFTNEKAPNRLLVFHGNAGYALDRSYYSEAFAAQHPTWEVYLFEYPGYGSRPGKPARDTFFQGADRALHELVGLDDRPLFLLGESVGSGMACYMAKEHPDKVAGLVLVTPFNRLSEVAKAHFPFIPIDLILREEYRNDEALHSYKGKVAIAIAERDEVVGPEQGRNLFDSYAGPKSLYALPNCGHNDFPIAPDSAWFQSVSRFLLEK